jgi:peptidoglycan-associated lipoprotein
MGIWTRFRLQTIITHQTENYEKFEAMRGSAVPLHMQDHPWIRCIFVLSTVPSVTFSSQKQGDFDMKKIAVVLASLLVVACASTPKTDSSHSSQANDKNTAATANAAPVSAAQIELSKLTAAIQNLEKQSDYFDYNKAIVKHEYLDVIRKEAEFIKTHKQDVVTLEGNADERGGDQYNLTLGDERAVAVEKSLQKLGVSAAQIKVVSLGKEKPRLSCHQEKCWKENRRVDFVHKLS